MKRYRSRRTRGFALIDALVALGVAALTLSLLTSASWGLKLASDRRAVLEATQPSDWLLARRVMIGWIGNVTSQGPRGAGGYLIGTATTMRMIVRDRAAAQAYVGEFSVEGGVDAGWTLYASRHDGLLDARIASDTPRRSELLRSREPIRFLYLFRQSDGTGTVWRYETGGGDALPIAIAVETGDTRRLTTALNTTVSADCLAVLGPGGLEDRTCDVR